MRDSWLFRFMLVALFTGGLIGCRPHVQTQFVTQIDRKPEAADSRSTIAVLGSSVAAGWVTSYQARHDLQNGYAARLGRLLGPRGYTVKNISVPGNSTAAVLARMDEDLEPTNAEFVLIGLSLGNERLYDDRDAAVAAYSKNLPEIIERCRGKGRIPIVGLCYPYDRYDETDYAYLKRMNITIDSWGVPTINFLGALDDGTGHFVDGYTFDEGHPDNRGHEEFFRAIVPSMFDALSAGKPAPARPDEPGHTAVKRGEHVPLSFVPDDPVHSFAAGFSFRTTDTGAVAAVRAGAGFATVTVGDDGRLSYESVPGPTITTPAAVNDGEWHDVVLSHRYLLGKTSLYVDGKLAGETDESIGPRQFILGGSGREDAEAPKKADYRDWLVYRSALNADEVTYLRDGNLFTASMEVYAPLAGEKLKKNRVLTNLAWSTSRVVARPADAADHVAELERKIESARAARENEFVAEEKAVAEVDPAIYDAYAGEYELAPDNIVKIARENDCLFLHIHGDKTELFPESPEKFFVRTVGDVTVTFVKNNLGTVDRLVLDINGQKIPAERVD